MVYDAKKYANVLELNKVLELLRGQTTTESAAAATYDIVPCFDFEQTKTLLSDTDNAYLLLLKYSPPGFSGAHNVAPLVSQADAGLVLSKQELLNIAHTLKVVRIMREWRDNLDNNDTMPLDRLFFMLCPNRYLEEKLLFCIKNADELNDSASERLFSIRRKIKNAENNIRAKLDKILRSSDASKVLQDTIITQRDGRFVVPVKYEYKSQLPGLVHGSSTSGATLFIEPMAVVEINNELKALRSEQEEEIARILAELSSECAGFAEQISLSCKAVCELDLIFAKARLGIKMKASIPNINDEGIISLINARHPLIDEHRVVPISVDIGREYDSLIITGPNTGGKTVTLKTIGLLHMMAMCGLMIPAKENSQLAVFDRIFADIGDEQSIEQSLSTFSSHITNIVRILEQVNYNSLVLLDELGAGTDPIEGAALAKAILITLKDKGAKIAATTHYAELKTYALETERVQNAGCEFDVQTLRPTYRIISGVPGMSNAFAISSRLGVPREVVNLADSMLSDEQKRFESIVASLDDARKQAEADREEARKIRAQLESEKAANSRKSAEIVAKTDKVMENARQQAELIIEKTRQESNRLLDELNKLKKQFNRKNSAEVLSKARSLEKNAFNSVPKANKVDYKNMPELDRPIKEGDTVYLPAFSSQATVEEVSDGSKNITVSFGTARMRVSKDAVCLIEGQEEEKTVQKKVSGVTGKAKDGAASELDMRGLSCDEGIYLLDVYIDSVVLAKLDTVTIIHGKGTGVLRDAVRRHLRKHKAVESIRPGTYGEGEDGVTVVKMKK